MNDYYRTRRTVATEVKTEGIGLHTGESCAVTIKPAEPGSGRRFVRTDLEPPVEYQATVDQVSAFARTTVLEAEDEQLYTVEHLLSALYALGITDVRIEVNGPEIPALDGSARGFIDLIETVALEEVEGDSPVITIDEPVFVANRDQVLVILPANELRISCTISYDNEYIGDQTYTYVLDPETFGAEIAPSRTFGFKEEVDDLRSRNLALGGSLENAIVLDEDGNIIGDEPTFPDEFVRHKILDLIGDLALTGHYFTGHVVGLRNGHSLNAELASKLRRQFKKSPAAIPTASNVEPGGILDIEAIKSILPHRYPFLLVDRILVADHKNQLAMGIKNVTINEPFFQGHFPDDPVMPGVLIIESLAQLGAAMILGVPENKGKNSYFMGVDNVKWRRPVRPGDQLLLEVRGVRFRPGARVGKMEGQAYVRGELAAEGTFKFAIVSE